MAYESVPVHAVQLPPQQLEIDSKRREGVRMNEVRFLQDVAVKVWCSGVLCVFPPY